MTKAIVLATFAASALFAACEHGAPQPAPREMYPMGSRPSPVEPATPLPATGTPSASDNAATMGDPTTSEARPSPSANPALSPDQARPGSTQTRRHDGPLTVPPPDAGTPLPGNTQPSPTGQVNPGPSAMLETRRDLHSDDDLHLLPPAQRMPVTNIPAQAMPAGPASGDAPEPSSVKPDAGIQWDGGAPLPPIPDGGPLPQTRDASVPL